jgi:hypothetical protein
VEIDNQTTIAWRRRFTNPASCHALAMRVLQFAKRLEIVQHWLVCLALADQLSVNAAGHLPGCRGSQEKPQDSSNPAGFYR